MLQYPYNWDLPLLFTNLSRFCNPAETLKTNECGTLNNRIADDSTCLRNPTLPTYLPRVLHKKEESQISLRGTQRCRTHSNLPPPPRRRNRITPSIVEDTLRSPITGVRIVPLDEFLLSAIKCNTTFPSTSSSSVRLSLAEHQSGQISSSDRRLRERLARIPNMIGPYVCRLCGTLYADAVTLADHACPRMTSLAYSCPTCDKIFQCPANLASHQRWHQRKSVSKNTTNCLLQAQTDETLIPSTILPQNEETYPIQPKHSSFEVHQSTTVECINATFRVNRLLRTETEKPIKRSITPFSVEALLA